MFPYGSFMIAILTYGLKGGNLEKETHPLIVFIFEGKPFAKPFHQSTQYPQLSNNEPYLVPSPHPVPSKPPLITHAPVMFSRPLTFPTLCKYVLGQIRRESRLSGEESSYLLVIYSSSSRYQRRATH